MPNRRWFLPVAAAVLQRPTLWGSGLRAALRLSPRGWWRAWPPIPGPPSAYLRFRVQTNDGAPDANPTPNEVIAYLRWCRENGRVFGPAKDAPGIVGRARIARRFLGTSE